MSKLTPKDLHGFVPAVVTPFAEDGTILTEEFKTLVEYLISCGATAVCVAGDNGESWALSAAERGTLVGLAVEAAKGRVPIFAGIAAPTGPAVTENARAVIDAGAEALLAMPQISVLKASPDELRRRFELIGSFDMPTVVYNSPRRTGYEIGLDLLESLLDTAPIIGIKESSRDFFLLSHLIDRFKDRMSVMVGPCPYIFPGMALGAAGFIATGPELLGKTAGRIGALATQAPGPEMTRLHMALTEIYEVLMGTGTWPSSFKASLNAMGLPAGIPRDPVLPLGAEQAAKVDAVLAKYADLVVKP